MSKLRTVEFRESLIEKDKRCENYTINNWMEEYAEHMFQIKIEPYKQLIKELWKVQDILAEMGEIAIGYGFSERYDELKKQKDLLLKK